MKRKLLVLFLALTAVFTCAFALAACGGDNGNSVSMPSNPVKGTEGLEYYKFDDDCNVIGIGSCTATDIVIGNVYKGLPVTTINAAAFKDCTSITSVTISDGIKEIFNDAFSGCINLKSVTIPESVTKISQNAFKGCKSLTSVTFPDSMTYFNGMEMFKGCTSLTSVTLPDGITSIEREMFSGCRSLTRLTIPDSVTYIGYNAISGCSSLETITIPDGVVYISSYAFKGCNSLTSITVPDSVTNIDEGAFFGCNSLIEINLPFVGTRKSVGNIDGDSLGSIFASQNYSSSDTSAFVPLSLKSVTIRSGNISDYAFSNCSWLTSVTLGNGVESIWQYAFYNCSGLSGITIPDSVTDIRNNAFEGCSGITSIVIPDSVTSISNDVFKGCPIKTAKIPANAAKVIRDSYLKISDDYEGTKGPEDYLEINATLESVVITIGESLDSYAFRYCSSLKSITFPNSLTSIGESAFKDCLSLSSATIPESVTSIGSSAFEGCSSLASVIFHDSITGIGSNAFKGCSSLASVTIPDSVTSIGGSAFAGCSLLTSIIIPNPTASVASGAFYNCPIKNATIPKSAIDGIDKSGLKTLVLTSGETIFDSEFKDCIELTSVTIPDTVTSIKNRAFYNCSSLTDVIILNPTVSIGLYAFYGCPIENATIPMFALNSINKPALKTLVLTNGESIGADTFKNCSSLISVTLPDSVTDIAFGAFSDCNKLKEITVPFVGESKNGTENTHFGFIFGANTSEQNSTCVPESLKNVKIIGGREIGSYAFYNCKSLTDVTVGDDVESIGWFAFNGCASLTRLTIGRSVNSIGSNAFFECYHLVELYNKSALNITVNNSYNFGFVSLYAKNIYTNGESKLNFGADGFIVYDGNTVINYIGDETALTISDGVTEIGGYAFYMSSSLKSVTIPKSVTVIGDYAFYNCNTLTDIFFEGSKEEWREITKGSSWNLGAGNYTVRCSDGTI